MIAEIFPSVATGNVVAPASKSIAHRALVCGALSEKSLISGLDFSDDINATIGCLKSLGATVTYLNDNTVEIGGLCPSNISDAIIDCNESGSTLRFLIPICLLSDNETVINGTKRLLERPLSVYQDICQKQNLLFKKNDNNSISVKGILSAGEYYIDGSISSQFVTGLLFALSLCRDDSTIFLSENAQSIPYINITVDIMKQFGVVIERDSDLIYKIKGNQKYNSLNYTVEGDYSNAAFLDAFNLIGGNVNVLGLKNESLQGDKIYCDLFKRINNDKPYISLKDCPDLGPILFALAGLNNGAVFTDTARLKIKESDRIAAMKSELIKFGIELKEANDCVTVYGGNYHKPTDYLYSHNDHRIAMSLSVLASVTGGIIKDAGAVSKSFPNFFKIIKSLGIEVDISDT